MITDAIKQVIECQSLSFEEAQAAMTEIMEGQATDAQIASFITALRMKGETVAEIAGFARVMRDKAVPIRTKHEVVVDTCGTGGDVSGTFNVSTTAAFVVAGAGVAVAKHGNRSVSSKCGSADLLEALGVQIEIEAEEVEESINEIGIGFMFAPLMHPAMKHAMGPRKELGVRTVFNILGPLCNPADVKHQVLGVYSPDIAPLMAEALACLGAQHVLVVHGQGLDELTVTGDSQVAELRDGKVSTYAVELDCLDIKKARLEDILGGTVEENVAITNSVLAGVPGATRDMTLLNAAAALVAADKTESIKEGLEIAARSIDSGAAKNKLDALITFTNL